MNLSFFRIAPNLYSVAVGCGTFYFNYRTIIAFKLPNDPMIIKWDVFNQTEARGSAVNSLRYIHKEYDAAPPDRFKDLLERAYNQVIEEILITRVNNKMRADKIAQPQPHLAFKLTSDKKIGI
jgi:hypothetical protein